MRREALIVGINQYPFLKDTTTGKTKHLTTPAADAEAIAQLLEADDNFQVQRLPKREIDGKIQVDPNGQVSLGELSREINKLFCSDNNRDTALLFFAGHGLQQLNSLGNKRKISLATSDTKGTGENSILLNDLWELLEGSPVKEQIIWLDSCYSGGLLEFQDSDLPRRISGLRRFIIAASHSSEVAYARLDSKHGVLSGSLIDGLDSGKTPHGDWITDRTLADFVERELKVYYQQTKIPQIPQIRRPEQEIKLILGKAQSSFREEIETIKSRELTIPFVLPQLDVSTFTGRSQELQTLGELLLNLPGTKECSIAGLAGTGGIGKSALACHFATLHKDDFPDGVIGLRVDGKDVNTIAREFARHCDVEIAPEDERNAASIMQEVFANRRMLLIFDNADNASVRVLRPGGDQCAVIVTTRDRALPISLDIPDKARINLPTLSNSDSLNLLQKLLGEKRVTEELGASLDLIELSGKLPLALQIIGAALKLHEGRSLADYAASLTEERRLARLRIRGDEHLDISSCFSLSLKLLQTEEIDFFACLSVCAGDGFSLRTAMVVNDCDEYSTLDYLEYFYQLSLLNYSEVEKNRFVFHPLIRIFAQDLAIERNLRDEAQARHAHFFIEFVKSSQVKDPSAVFVLAKELKEILLASEWLQNRKIADYKFVFCLLPFLQRYHYWQQAADLIYGFQLLAQRKEEWNAVVILCIQQSKFLSLLGKWLKSEEVLNQITEIFDKIQEQDIRQRCRAMWLNAVGGVLQRQGRLNEASTILDESILVAEKIDDKKYLSTNLNTLRVVLQQLGQLNEGVFNLQRFTQIVEQKNSTNSLVISLSVLGELLQEQERFDEAVIVFERSIEILMAIGDGKQLINNLETLGKILNHQGNSGKAIIIFQKVIKIAEQLNDQRQVVHLEILEQLLQENQRFDEVIIVLRKKIDIAEQLNERRMQLDCLSKLRRILQKQEHFDEAVTVLQSSIAIAEQIEDKKTLVRHLCVLGKLLQRQGNFDKAVIVIQRSVEISEQFNQKRSLIRSLNILQKVLKYQGCFDQLLQFLRYRIDACEKRDDREKQLIILSCLADVLQQQGNLDETVKTLEKAIVVSDFISDSLENKRNIAIIFNKLGNIFKQKRKLDEAEKALRRSQEICEELNDPNILVKTLHILGKVLEQQHKLHEAEMTLRQCYNLSEKLADQRGQAIILNSLGQIIQYQEGEDKLDLALMYFRASIKLGEEIGDQKHLATVHTTIGKALLKNGKIEQAVEELRKGFEIDESLQNASGLSKVTSRLTYALVKLGRRKDAIDYCQRALNIKPDDLYFLQILDKVSLQPKPTAKPIIKRSSVK